MLLQNCRRVELLSTGWFWTHMGGVEVEVLDIRIASKEEVAGDHGEQGGDVMLIEVGQAFPESKRIIPRNLHFMEGADWRDLFTCFRCAVANNQQLFGEPEIKPILYHVHCESNQRIYFLFWQ